MRRGAASGAAAPAVALVVAGGAQALSLAWPGSGQPLWWLQIVSLAGFAWLLRRAPGALAAALRGWLFATAWLVGTFWWLFISMHTYGGLAAPLAALAVLGLAAFLGAYYAIASWCFWALRPKGRALQAIVFAALWLLAELARGVLWTGFPWGAGGYAHTDGPLAALARWVGVYGVGALAAALAMALAQVRPADVLRARAWLGAGALALVLWGAADGRERALAQELTTLVHGAFATEAVEAAAQALFGQGDLAAVPADVLDAALREVPHAEIPREDITDGELPDIVDLLVRSGLSPSRGQARRTIGEGGAYVNNVRVEDEAFRVPVGDLLHGRYLVLRRGRRTLAGAIVEG